MGQTRGGSPVSFNFINTTMETIKSITDMATGVVSSVDSTINAVNERVENVGNEIGGNLLTKVAVSDWLC